MTSYMGIDFANIDTNIGRCKLSVDFERRALTPSIAADEPTASDYVAIDCPFGTSEGFFKLLSGQVPNACEWDAGLKTRQTENWLRRVLWEYSTNYYWRSLDVREPQHYVNQTAHVQPSVGLVIVPAFLRWVMCSHKLTPAQLVDARSGNGRLVEAHPRAFLYSIIERIYRVVGKQSNEIDWKHELTNVVRYKDKKGVSRLAERTQVYGFLQKYSSAWLWNDFTLDDADDHLLQTDHAFDAFLAAMTAYAFASNQVISFTEAGISSDTVAIEGHIAILQQPRAKAGNS
jgi:Protein of unknown function (DUF429)